MSERKVLNKYYPPDFDPSKIPRMKLAKNRQYTVRLMAPFNMRCATCGEYIYKGKKFNARKEDVENEDYLGIRIYRFYIKMWNPSENTEPPQCFVDLLNDEDAESSEGEEVIEEVREDLIPELENLNLEPGSECFLIQEDGSLAPMVVPDRESSNVDIDDSSDVDERGAALVRATSSITPHQVSSVAASLVEPVATSRCSAKGFPTRRRGRRVRGTGLVRESARGVRGQNAWSRGQPLVERFASDEELSAPLREEIERVTVQRHRRERATRGSRVADVEEEDANEESEFFDCEEFVWTSMDGWTGAKEPFYNEAAGPTRLVENAYDAFRSYWDDSLLTHIVTETNRYARQIQSERFRKAWFDTNIDELLILFAFWMMLGIIKMPTIKSCFTKMTILRTEIFRAMFSEDRYWNLNRAFHLANGSRDANDPDNILYPMGPVLEHLNKKFQENYVLQQDICIDESLTLWKGLVGFKQYIKTKSARYGIKTYELCESSTGYLWSFFVYIGRQTSNSTVPSRVSTVIKLIQPLLNLGHVLYMDNWFNSPTLARYLKRRRTDCVGTLRPSRKHVPPVIQRVPLAEGEFVARQSGDIMIVALQDRKRINLISTFHDVSQVQKEARPDRPSQYKLSIVDDYNQGMGGVDRMDQMLEPYLVERKQCVKWTKKLFKRLLNVSIQNSRILLEKSSGTNVSAVAFRLDLVQSILSRHRNNVPTRNPQNPPQHPRVSYEQFPEKRLTERHFIRRIPVTDEMRAAVKHKTNLGRRQCVWCTANGRKQSRTVYECPKCNVPLCLDFCFEQFHTIP